jgi:hypothetical protein
MFHRILPFAIPTFHRSAAHCLSGIRLWALALLLLALSTSASAAPITLAWDAVSDADLAGYKLYYGYASREYSVHVDVGKYITTEMSGLEDASIYYFAVTAYDTAGNESGFSNEVQYDLAAHDTDGDGLNDWDEITRYKTNLDRADTDGDGLRDGDEVNDHDTDPTRADTDGDGFSDGAEVSKGSDPRDPGSIPEPNAVVFAVNAGGAEYAGMDSTVYQADALFSGGSTDTKTLAITGTTDDQLYQSWRYGKFSYAVPVANGNYLVTLKFAENLWSQAGQRVFNVSMEGKVVLSKLDVVAKVGPNAAYDVTLPVTVTDGVLSISFQSVVGNAMVNAIRVQPKEVVFAVNAGGAQYVGTDDTGYEADARFSGGSTDTKTPAITGTADDQLYHSWRYGTFSYAVPVADGNYLVTLKFADNLWSQAGQRVFNVSMEGKVVLSNLDVVAEVGPNAAYDVTLPVTVTDGVLSISFQSVVGNAMVSGIVVFAD